MAQRRGGERGVANLVTCLILLVFGALGLTAGCSVEAEPEALESSSQEQTLCTCPKSTPCVTYTCFKTQCIETITKDGESCEDKAGGFKGICLEALCCPGCVVKGKLGTSACARAEGTDPEQCGQSGEYCSNCKADSCLAGTCNARKQCNPVPEGEACVGVPGACHDGSCCQGCIDGNGACVSGGAVDACGVSDGKLAKCKSCNDGNDCNGKETCSEGACKSGTPIDCNDNNPCTADSCSSGGCVNTPLTGQACSDSDPCTTGDKCTADGKCAPGTQVNCDDGQFCTNDSCKDGLCVNAPKPTTTDCEDNNQCTTGDKCTTDGKCAGTSSTSFSCDDDNVCTIDEQPSCAVEACTHLPALATVACITDKCHATGHCSGTDGDCVAGPEISCDDNNPCTDDSCEPDKGCVYKNNTDDCSDGDPCTENDFCVKGDCVGKPMKCLALDACHEPGSCDKNSGTCTDPRAEDGKACPGGTCDSGGCVLDPNANPGAGGEAAGGAGPGAGGDGGLVGGAATTPTGDGGAGDQPSGQAGDGTVGEPERPFKRKPGGCSCELPGSGGGDHRTLSLIGLTLLAGTALWRRRRERAAA